MSAGRQQVTGNINSFNSSININFITVTDTEGRQILQRLSPLEPHQQHEDVRTNRYDGVGSRVLKTNEFRRWSGMEGGCVEQVLFCCGNPGVGKTYLSSLVIDTLCDQTGERVAVVGLYCDFLAQQEQSTTNMLGAMLKQLVSAGGTPEHIEEAFQKAKKGFGCRGLRLPDLVEVLKKTIASLQGVFICIDALDESTPKHRRELLESLREIARVSQNTRIFLTGRPYIDHEIAEYFSEVARISVSPSQDDIKSYLKMKLNGDPARNIMNDELRADIMRIIPEKISEIFLLVSLNIDAILGETTPYLRRKKLDEITQGERLGDAYATTLSRVRAQQGGWSELGMKVLMWVSHSKQPLHVDELCHALGVEEGFADLNTQNIPAIETLLSCCLGLITVEKATSTVRLVHHTLQEHLSDNPNLFLQPHSMVAEACLTYLNFHQVRSFSPAIRSVPPSIPFVEYASCHWATHARRGTTESVKTLALKLLDGYDKHISSKMLLLSGTGYWDQPFDQEDSPTGFTGLHGAAYLGCDEIIAALLEMNKWDAQATDCHGNTAIAWAARRGHEGVVRIMLERSDVNPDTADDQYGQTPLSWAADNGHEGIVMILLKRNDVNADTADDKYGRTPLSWAAGSGHEAVVRRLLERRDVNPDTIDDEYGRTPLSWAAENGHEGVVRIMLGRDGVNPDKTDNRSRTPLWWAAQNGYGGVVSILLERNNVNPDKADNRSRTPLWVAARSGHEEVVSILLERNDVSPDTADTIYHRTPLQWALRYRYERITKMLRERTDSVPRCVANQQSTMLFSPKQPEPPEPPSKRARRS